MAMIGDYEISEADAVALGLNPAMHRGSAAEREAAERLDRMKSLAASLGLNPERAVKLPEMKQLMGEMEDAGTR